jgi:hypothetical protein
MAGHRLRPDRPPVPGDAARQQQLPRDEPHHQLLSAGKPPGPALDLSVTLKCVISQRLVKKPDGGAFPPLKSAQHAPHRRTDRKGRAQRHQGRHGAKHGARAARPSSRPVPALQGIITLDEALANADSANNLQLVINNAAARPRRKPRRRRRKPVAAMTKSSGPAVPSATSSSTWTTDARRVLATKALGADRASVGHPDDAGCLDLIASWLVPLGFASSASMPAASRTSGRAAALPAAALLRRPYRRGAAPARWSNGPRHPSSRPCATACLYGRGAADMKSSIAAFVTAMERFLAESPCHHTGSIFGLAAHLRRGRRRRGRHGARGGGAQGARRGDRLLHRRRTHLRRPASATPSRTAAAVRSPPAVVKGVQGHVAYPHLVKNPVHLAAPALAELAATPGTPATTTFRRPASRFPTPMPAPAPATSCRAASRSLQFPLFHRQHGGRPASPRTRDARPPQLEYDIAGPSAPALPDPARRAGARR